MAKTRHINFKISEADYRKIESMKNGKTIGHLMRNLIAEAVETERKEAQSFLELMGKLESSDLSKIAERTEGILETNRRILKEAIRANIAVEELAKLRLMRSDIYQKYIQVVEKRLEDMRINS